ncbi:MAG: DUF3419 family protein [Williamsia sp.]|nr:DUF3419 family protein [Williamsia sp.]
MIYYSHVNEDNRIERDLLRRSGCNTVVAVAGSGERMLALMDVEGCRIFHAVDLNREALYLLQLKLAALENMEVEEYWQFCGHYPAPAGWRKKQFDRIKANLDRGCLLYWQEKARRIEKGILNSGHFERFLQRVRPLVRFFLGKNFELIFSGAGALSGKFPHRRWKLLKHLFCYPLVYKAGGNQDPAFTGTGAQTGLIPVALDEVIRRGEAPACFMAHLIFKGHLREMHPVHLPPSLQKEVLQKIRQRLITKNFEICFHHIDLLAFTQMGLPASARSVFYSFSDILSFEDRHYLEKLLDHTVGPGSTIVWRTFLRNRLDGNSRIMLAKKFPCLQDRTAAESTRMYQVFSIAATTNKQHL